MVVAYPNIVLYLQENPIAYSITILIGFFMLSKFFVILTQRVFLQLTKKTKTEIDDIIVKRTNRPISIILLLIGVRLALHPFRLGQTAVDIAENIILSLIIVVVTYIVIIVFDTLIDAWGKKFAAATPTYLDDSLVVIFHKFSRIFLSLLGLMFILSSWGVQIGPLITSLGIAGVAVAFALQATLGNIFGGISLILDKSVKVGDVIRVDAETVGTVIDVGLRSTKVKTFDNEVIIVPNGKLAETKFMNYLLPDPKVRCVIEFGVEYGSDVDKVKQIVLDTINRIPNVLAEPEQQKAKVMFMEMADFALKFRALFWVATFDERFPTKDVALTKIYNALRANNIGIPFPTRTVYLKSPAEKI